MSLSGNGTIVAIGGPGDDNSIGATWIFSTKASPPPSLSPLPQCVKPCMTDYLVDRLVCNFNIGLLIILAKRICELEARLKKRQCLWKALTPFHCYYKSFTSKSGERKSIYDGSCLQGFIQDKKEFRREKISKWIPTGSPTQSPTRRPTSK